ncbi:MAG: hypothetical protein HYS23_11765 [Geobacter sp.]|nr:hypothetical protein [Geobacter sp.]
MRKLMLLVLILTGVNIYANERVSAPAVEEIKSVEIWRGRDDGKLVELASYGPAIKKAHGTAEVFDNISGTALEAKGVERQALSEKIFLDNRFCFI